MNNKTDILYKIDTLRLALAYKTHELVSDYADYGYSELIEALDEYLPCPIEFRALNGRSYTANYESRLFHDWAKRYHSEQIEQLIKIEKQRIGNS